MLKYTLIADGSSDRILLNIIKWLLSDLFPALSTEANFADFRMLQKPPKSLKDKVEFSKKYYPFDLLFIHRDAEKTDLKMIPQRIEEVKKELDDTMFEKTVCIIPIKMMETWLLIDEAAIKKAAGNRSYKENILLPAVKQLEKEAQPKQILHQLIEEASGLKGRQLNKLNVEKRVHWVAENIEDYSPLRNLEAFKIFEKDLFEKVNAFEKNNENTTNL